MVTRSARAKIKETSIAQTSQIVGKERGRQATVTGEQNSKQRSDEFKVGEHKINNKKRKTESTVDPKNATNK